MGTRNIQIICGISLAVLCSIALLLPGDSEAKTWIVDDDGGGDFTSLESAIENATDEDTLRVYSGEYHGNLIVNKPLSIIGNGSDTVEIIGEGNNDVIRITKDDVFVSGVKISNTGRTQSAAGIEILTSNCTISYCNISGNTGNGIIVKDRGNNTIAHNIISNNLWHGINLNSANNNTIINNTCEENFWAGILLTTSSNDNIITNNTCKIINDGYGIVLYSESNNNRVANNSISSSSYAISLWGTSNNTVENNSMNGSGINVDYIGDEAPTTYEWMVHTINESNSLNGKQVFYSIHATDITVPSDVGQIIIANGSEITIEDQKCTNSYIGIIIGYSSNITLNDVNCSYNYQNGLWLISSQDVNITNSTLFENSNGLVVEGPSSFIEIHGSHIYMNSGMGINASKLNGSSVKASRNWWGHISGPYHEQNNSDGKGNSVTDNVEFQDWIDWPPYDDYEVPKVSVSLSPDDIIKGDPVDMEGIVPTSTPIAAYAWSSSIDGEFYNGSVSNFTLYDYQMEEGFEDNQHSMNTSGDQIWNITDSEKYTGDRSIMSGNISDLETSVLEMQISGMGQLSFYWRVDSEPNFDFLRFFIDNDLIEEISGDIDWEYFSYNLSVGEHTIQWSYVKDKSLSWGSDAGYVDDIHFTSSNSLSNGTHTISLKVEDEYGIWSNDDSTSLTINGRPVGRIESISPNPALNVDTIEFKAFASDDGTIERYVWTSSLDGEFYNGTESSISNSDLSNGPHNITLMVQDDRGVWSFVDVMALIVNGKPIGNIVSISPDPALDIDTVEFVANGTDDGSIVQYRWISSIDGEFYNDTDASFSFGDLSNGTHIITMSVQDDMDIWSSEITRHFTVNGKPVVRIDDISPSPALDIDDITMSANATDDGTIERYVWTSSLDGEFYNGTEPTIVSGDLTNGTHVISLMVQDNNGTWSETVTYILTINGKPVGTIISISPDPALDIESMFFNGSATDDGAVVRFLWNSSLDGIFFDGQNSSFVYDDLSNGSHEISLMVQDNNGTWSDKVAMIIKVNGKPVVRIVNVTPDQALDIDDIVFTGLGSDDGSIQRYVWWSQRDGELYNDSQAEFTSSDLSNGTHTISLRVQDNDGVWSDMVQINITVNGKPISIIQEISPNPTLDIEEITFTGSGFDDDGLVLYVWWSSLNGEFYNDTAPSFTIQTLSNGTHEIRFKVLDTNGTWSDEVSMILEINGKPRIVSMDASPNPALDIDIVRFSGETDDDKGIARYVWTSSLDGEFYNGSSPSFDFADLSNGTHTITLLVEDSNGTWSDSIDMQLIINGKPTAEIVSISPSNALQGEPVSFSGNGNDDGSISLFRWWSSIDNEIYNGTEDNFDRSDLSNGTHEIRFGVMDNDGVWSNDEVSSVDVNGAPVAMITDISPNPMLHVENVGCLGTGFDDDTIVTYVWGSSIDGELYQGPAGNQQFNGLTNGTHTIRLRVQDNDGAWSEDVTMELVVNGKPTSGIVEIVPDVALVSEDITFEAWSSDDGTIVLYEWTSSQDGVIFSGPADNFSSTGLLLGDHEITLRVQDDLGAWSDTSHGTLLVHERPIAAILTVTPGSAVEDETIFFEGTGSDDGTIVSYKWNSDEDGLLYDGDEQSFDTNSLSNGTHNITLKVMDDNGIWSDPIHIEVEVNGRPRAVIGVISPNPAGVNITITFNGWGTDDGALARYVWTSSIDGEIHNGTEPGFTSSELSTGSHLITLLVQDDHGVWSDVGESEPITLHVYTYPIASIDPVEPNPSMVGDEIDLVGNTTNGEPIALYVWRSSIDEEFYNGPEREISFHGFSEGEHEIFLKVKSDFDLWSEEVSTNLTVYPKPVGEIVSINPLEITVGETITFTGNGISEDTITRYFWRSSINAQIYDGPETSFQLSTLTVGEHSIILSVQTEHGFWSVATTSTVTVLAENKIPQVQITDPEQNDIISGIVFLSGSSNDKDGSIVRVEISIVDGEWLNATSTGAEEWQFAWDTNAVDNGVYTIRIRSYDGEEYSELSEITLIVENKDDSSDSSNTFVIALLVILIVTVVILVLTVRKKSNTPDQSGKGKGSK